MQHYSKKYLAQKKTWYSPIAEVYNKARPQYPKVAIDRVVKLGKLPDRATILEIGCGPGTATVALAKLGFSITCLEPNPDFCAIARRHCAKYPKVEIHDTSFEKWELQENRFDAVLAATSMHWISPEVAYLKAGTALHDDGALILLWNVPAIPTFAVYQTLQEVYQAYAPSLSHYKGRGEHIKELKEMGQLVIRSGHFKDLVFEQTTGEITYSIDEYLTLLSTFSPYIELEAQSRDKLFAGLREKIEQNFGGDIHLLSLCALHVARKY